MIMSTAFPTLKPQMRFFSKPRSKVVVSKTSIYLVKPMSHKQLIMTDAEEREFMEDLENSANPLVNTLDPKRRSNIAKAARATINDERFKVSLRIPKGDLTRLKSRALQEGIPYQTLINSIIHKYVTS